MRRFVLVAAVLAAAALAVALVLSVRGDAPPIAVPAEPEPAVSGATGAAPAASAAASPPAARGAIEGTVRDVAGAPLAGIHVRLVSRGDGLAAAPAVEVRTDFEGSFRIDGVELGRAALVAHQSGVAVGTSRAVRVGGDRTVRADFVLPEAGILAGRITGAGERPPPAGTEVIAVPMNAGLGALQIARAAVGANGDYRLPLPAGEYRIHAAPAGAPLGDLRVPPAFAAVRSEGTTRTDLVASVAVAEAGVAVRVNEPGGAASAGAIVTLSRAGDPRVALATTAGEDGRAIVSKGMGVAGQQVTIHARSGGRTGEWTGAFPEAGELVVPLRPGGALEGTVTAGGRPARGFTVQVASAPGAGAWRTVETHRFAADRLELGDLPPEPLRLTIRADDGRSATLDVTLAPAEVRHADIALEGAAVVPAAARR
jgi:hypothetical protein